VLSQKRGGTGALLDCRTLGPFQRESETDHFSEQKGDNSDGKEKLQYSKAPHRQAQGRERGGFRRSEEEQEIPAGKQLEGGTIKKT